ncbi:alpha/beta fold hydrolase [Nocardiopsis aegyptia]|uniref:alpha/beta fold hydrolase n=1 Tax=Nocardiopsis aegyptia TaxID=220378 RepID=UPI003670F758
MFTLTGRDGLTIHVHEWVPEAPLRGVVQISHGMGEHAARYAPLAAALNAHGYAVYADDHRGHGLSMHDGPGELGENGWNLLIDDMAALSREVGARHPDLPLVLVAHSLGSFAAQQYLLDHPGLADGVALCGTTAVDLLLSRLVESGAADTMAYFNAAFEPLRTEADWLSRDESQVDAYVADPLCGFGLTDTSTGLLLTAAFERLGDPSGAPDDLPLYVLVGDRDPLNQGLEFSDALVDRYRRAGVADLTYRVYEGARHELFNETNREEVFAELIAWIDRVTSDDVPEPGASEPTVPAGKAVASPEPVQDDACP